MVLVFFCVSGVLGSMRKHPSLTTREGEPKASRSLGADMALLAEALAAHPGAVVVIGNDWPFYYDISTLRAACGESGRHIVNVVRTLGDTKELALLDFMSSRAEPFVVIASPDFEFTELTASRRIDVNRQHGFDDEAHARLIEHLHTLGEHASNPLSDDDMLRATVGSRDLRRAQKYISPIRAGNDAAFQSSLRLLIAKS
ncbi:hypothetical protein PQR46_33315 [Paraburkholderia sediminicola]|uniref:hypothetical protein n=1 Tax=Paraburkholderia TaxID=1822464 RepID=UPI0038BD5E5D